MFAMKTFEIAIVLNILESRKCPTASASCRKVPEFDTLLLCQARCDDDHDNDNDDYNNDSSDRGLSVNRKEKLLSPVAAFPVRNSVVLPGRKDVGKYFS